MTGVTEEQLDEFDEYRIVYDSLTVSEIADWNRMFAAKYPGQAHFAVWVASHALHLASDVVELGGYRGELARYILARDPVIRSWVNHEILPVPSVCTDPRYRTIVETHRFGWEHPGWAGDTLVLSHVLEHLNEPQAEALFATFPRFTRVYIDAPLVGGAGWWRTSTAHILCWTWDDVAARAAALGMDAWFLATTRYGAEAWMLEQ